MGNSNNRSDNRRRFLANVRRASTASGRSIAVTEHAICRYVERVIGIPVKDICECIVPPSQEASIAALGDGEYPIGSPPTHKVLVKDGAVVTLWTGEHDRDHHA